MTENVVITETNMPNVPLLSRGKVRDIYDLGEHLLLVATDRISAFDVIMPTPIPDNGRILTPLSVFWFKKFEGKVR
ncbi:MAG TPA: phosphoribosylaminoimidazolesuccinocarboxamide synthase, partial [Deltaproteobacteria bacterium]|nr:phosphoribosylaminoimidazolesuccinocarboxamide synthase [Deltaproteobacteria bacterium]